MIYGGPYYKVRDGHYFIQTNNPEDTMLKHYEERLAKEKGFILESWRHLVTCGPSAVCNSIAALVQLPKIALPGGGFLQPESALASWLNDLANTPTFLAARPELDPKTWPGHEVPQYYPAAAKAVLGYTKGEFSWGARWEELTRLLKSGKALTVQLSSPPHYIALVAYDDNRDEIIFHDSWPRAANGFDGFCRRMKSGEFQLEPLKIIWG